MGASIRPTKKQRELLEFIRQFIGEHGYSPSYREIMQGLNYTSVATVALHVNNLIKRGHLIKRGRSARSLEVVTEEQAGPEAGPITAGQEKWLVDQIEDQFKRIEQAAEKEVAHLDHLYVLVAALKVLGMEGAATAFVARLGSLKDQMATEPVPASNDETAEI